MRISNLLSRFTRDVSGTAAIEFAFILPLFTTLFIGTVEVANFIYAQQKLQSAADNIVNIINLQDDISNRAQLESIARILPRIVRPLDVGSDGYSVIVTVIQRDLGEDFAYVKAQPKFGAGPSGSNFSYNATATVNSDNEASLADLSFTFEEGDQVVIVEGYMRYNSIFGGAFVSNMLGLSNSFMYHRTPPAQPRIRRFQFGVGSDV